VWGWDAALKGRSYTNPIPAMHSRANHAADNAVEERPFEGRVASI